MTGMHNVNGPEDDGTNTSASINHAKRLVRDISLLLGIREQDIADPTTPGNIVAAVRTRLAAEDGYRTARAVEFERRDLATFAKAEADKFHRIAGDAEDVGDAVTATRCHAQAAAFRTMQAYVMRGDHEGAAERQEPVPAASTANPADYRSIALANGAKECNVYRHDDRTVIVVEMALNRKLAEVHDAIFIRTPAAKYERIELREVRSHHDSIAVDASATPSGELLDKPTDHLADLEHRIAELERSVRNNTRRLDLAAAACRLPEQWIKDMSSRTKIQLLAERLWSGLKEQA